MDAVKIVEGEVRELIRRRGLDPMEQTADVRRLVEAAVSDYDERALLGPLPPLGHLETARRHVFDAVAGFGPLQPLLDDPSIEEVWINAPHEIYVARNGESELTAISLTEQQVRDLVERMLKSSGRRLDLSSPFVDAALPDGSRLHVAIPDITRKHWAVNIRKFIARASRLEHLVELGSLTPQAARFLGAAVASGLNILVSGATQAGKTTMLNCLAANVGSRERVITVEEIFELQLPLRDVVGLQCRQPNLEGEGEIPLRRLVKEALRMRPDRLIVGEVREAESLDMLIALNSGLPGMCTVHANSAHDGAQTKKRVPIRRGRMPVAGLQRRRSASRKAIESDSIPCRHGDLGPPRRLRRGTGRNPQAVLRLLTVLRDGTDTLHRPDQFQGRSEPPGVFPHPEGHEQASGRSGHLDHLHEGARVPAKDAP